LGHALARFFLDQGISVWGCSRREPGDLCSHEMFRSVSCDVADFETVPQRLDDLFGDSINCDLAILNAGILSPFGDMRQVSLDDCRHVLDVNLWANKVLLDWLLERFPTLSQVATISSGAAVHGHRGWNAYSISKAALNMLTKLYSAEAVATHFVAIAPGLIDTHMQDVLCGLPEDDRYQSLKSLRQRKNTPEMPTPEQLAPRIAQVIADAPGKIESGTFIDVRKIDW
ncbi:MAG: SDR family oxidoreductase, partial [Planctomycetaceae bacterium]|nr:SDR family oxidoreductase [Planctomycetaceae bacterium]